MRWYGLTVCIIASGPSLTRVDAAYARFHADRVIAINESWLMEPSADVLYGADRAWWMTRAPSADQFKGDRWTQQRGWKKHEPPAPLQVIRSEQGHGLAPPGSDFVYTGYNSTYQALGLSVIWGAKRIVLLGLDLQGKPDAMHWHKDHAQPLANPMSALPGMREAFTRAAPKLDEYGVSVFNASRRTALTCFPRVTLEDVFG